MFSIEDSQHHIWQMTPHPFMPRYPHIGFTSCRCNITLEDSNSIRLAVGWPAWEWIIVAVQLRWLILGQWEGRRGRGNTVHVKWLHDLCIFIGRYSYFPYGGEGEKKSSCFLVPWPINIPHLLSWQLAPHFCPSLPVQSPKRPGLHHLGDKLPISPGEHLWGWALWQSSSNTCVEERHGRL